MGYNPRYNQTPDKNTTILPSGRTINQAVARATQRRSYGDQLLGADLRLLNAINGRKQYNTRQANGNGIR
jgi:hypothetical protein